LDQAEGFTPDERKSAKRSIRKYLNNPGTAYPSAEMKGVTLDSVYRYGNVRLDTAQSKEAKSFIDLVKSYTTITTSPSDFLMNYFKGSSTKDVQLASFVDSYRINDKKFRDGIEWGGTCFSFYSLITFLVAFLLPILARKTSLSQAHAVALFMGGLGLISTYFIQNQYFLLLSMVGVGIAWASTVSLPYAMLSGSLPPERMGVYMGIFNFFIVIPEIISALSFDWILDHVLNRNMALFLACGGLLLLLAAIFSWKIKKVENV
jgi:MFS family permease